jgi:cold shock CspA family protein
VAEIGRILEFDEHRGIGRIEPQSASEAAPVMFHCIEIADGSRSIAQGTEVTYRVRLKLGRREAFAVTPR